MNDPGGRRGLQPTSIVILILSDSLREATLLGNLCEHRSWLFGTGKSVEDYARSLEAAPPHTIITRHKLAEGYSDDLFARVAQQSSHAPKIIVLMPANCTVAEEARQLRLGADCVLRDPLRLEVLLAYLEKFETRPSSRIAPTPAKPVTIRFAGAEIRMLEHEISRGARTVQTTPRVIELLRLLARTPGKVVPYPLIYSEVFGRRFTGETANARVLLARTVADFRKLGVDLRKEIAVIPKSGYLYKPAG